MKSTSPSVWVWAWWWGRWWWRQNTNVSKANFRSPQRGHGWSQVAGAGYALWAWLISWTSQVALVVKNPPVSDRNEEMPAWSLSWEDPLEEEMAIHSSILAWRIPRTEEPGELQSIGSHRVRHNWSDFTRMHIKRFWAIRSNPEPESLKFIAEMIQTAFSTPFPSHPFYLILFIVPLTHLLCKRWELSGTSQKRGPV